MGRFGTDRQQTQIPTESTYSSAACGHLFCTLLLGVASSQQPWNLQAATEYALPVRPRCCPPFRALCQLSRPAPDV
jgi:hypothetical protein